MQKHPSGATFMLTGARRGLCSLALAAGLLAAGLGAEGRAETIGFDFGGGETVATVTGTTGGTMTFSLAVGGPLDLLGSNNFALDVFNVANVLISSVNFIGLAELPGTNPYGDTTIPPNGLLIDFAFYELMTWSVDVTASDLAPVTLRVTSTLAPADGPLSPLLSVAFSGGDLELVSAPVPLPGTLPLVAAGLAVLIALGRRRRRA